MREDVRRNWLVVVPLALYLALSVAAVLVWDRNGRHTLTGDEPHYLVVASAIAEDGTFENTAAYAREFRAREIFPTGLAERDAVPSPENTHAVAGPHGLFNVHNIGLPLLLAVPFALGGVLGAKVAMIAFNASVVLACWGATRVFTDDPVARAWATGVAAVAAPFVFAAGQIYPDVLAGAISLAAVVRCARIDARVRLDGVGAIAVLIAFLPWLQLKFTAVAIVLAVALAVRGYVVSGRRQIATSALAPLVVSLALHAYYNWYAFGRVTGPYGEDALEPGARGAMVLLGLHVDTNQGWVWQAPVWLIGVAASAALIVRRFGPAVLALAAYVLLIVPNAFHPNWYGGESFVGRFFWSAAAVLLLPVSAGLIVLFARSRTAVLAVTAVAVTALAVQYVPAVFGDGTLLRPRLETMARAYPVHAGPLAGVLPKLYEADWAWRQPVTWASLLILPAAAWVGASGPRGHRRWVWRAGPLAVALVATVVAGVAWAAPDRSEFALHRLRHQVGADTGDGWRAESGEDGFLAYGGLLDLDGGSYEVRAGVRSAADAGQPAGTLDVLEWPEKTDRPETLAAGPLTGTGGVTETQALRFTVEGETRRFEFRVHTNGSADLTLTSLVVARID